MPSEIVLLLLSMILGTKTKTTSATTKTRRQRRNPTQNLVVDKTGLQIVPLAMCLAAIELLA
jgi:hypothetical protein